MCGICGVVALGRPPEVETVASDAATRSRHRGPDGARRLRRRRASRSASARLAIIDLSRRGAASRSRATTARCSSLHNGEIYNYLRAARGARGDAAIASARRPTPRSCSRAYRGVGRALRRALQRHVGVRALGRPARSGSSARATASAIKPFYYRCDGGRFAFASEPQAFRADPRAALEPNPRAVRDYLEQGYLDHTDETFFAGIRELPPGALAHVRRARAAHSSATGRSSRSDAARAIRPRRCASSSSTRCACGCAATCRVGTCLSGGIDSSAIAVAVDHLLRTEAENARPVGERQQTFTAYFEDAGFDERPFAGAVVEQTGAEPHWVSFDAEELVDEPARRSSRRRASRSARRASSRQWYVMREAQRAGLKVMLDGQGGDEMLAGYRAYFGYRFADLLAARRRSASCRASCARSPASKRALRWSPARRARSRRTCRTRCGCGARRALRGARCARRTRTLRGAAGRRRATAAPLPGPAAPAATS